MSVGKWIAAGFGVAALSAVVVQAQYPDTGEPAYTLVQEDTAFQLRDYPAIVVAEVTHSGSRREASSKSFRRLAAYIFAQDRPAGGERIAMTSPVIQDRRAQNESIEMTAPVLQDEAVEGQWRMRFVMPAKFTLETLPKAPADITLTKVPARRMATVRFNGYARPNEIAIMEAKLTEWMKDQGIKAISGFEYAFYDAPMVPGERRRNEVMIEVAAPDFD